MRVPTKALAGVAAAAMMTVTAAPAQAQYYDYRHRDRGIDAGDVIAGVAVIGGIAAIVAALSRDGSRYGYDGRYRYGNDYRAAVNGCAYEAERFARRGQVRITDVDRVSGSRYRVRGEVQGYGYSRYDRYDRYGYGRYGADRFTCYAYGNGRIQDFRMRG